MASRPSAKASPKATPLHPSPTAKGPKPGATNFISPPSPPGVEVIAAPYVKPPSRVLPQVPILKPPVGNPLPAARAPPDPSPPMPSVSDAPPDCVPITFDEEANCIVIGESEYYYPSRDTISTVGQLCSFLEAQDDFRGKAIQPLSSRARKIGSREAKSITVSFIKVEDAMCTHPGKFTYDSTGVRAGAVTPLSLPSTQAPLAKASAQVHGPSSAPTAVVAPPVSSVERAKLAALERFKAEKAQKEELLPDPMPSGKPPTKVSNKELLQGLDDAEEGDKELNFGKFGKTVAPPGRRLPATRYRKHLEDLKKRSKRMEYRQKFFVMEKEKKQEELQKRLDEIDEENLRAERERRKKQEEEYDSLYGAELERKKKLQAASVASMLDELDSFGSEEPSGPSEPLDPDAALFALTPGFSERQEENEFALQTGAVGSGTSRSQGRPKQRLTLMLKDMLNSEDEPTSQDAIVDFSALARAPKKAGEQDAKERKLEELRQRKEELRRREEELNAQLANRPASATTAELLSGADEEAGYKTIMVQGRPRRVPVSASSVTLVGAAPVGSGRRVKP